MASNNNMKQKQIKNANAQAKNNAKNNKQKKEMSSKEENMKHTKTCKC